MAVVGGIDPTTHDAVYFAAATSPTAAQDVSVQSVVALQMKTGATHPCEGFTPPPKVAVGETFSADGKTRQIGIIRAAQSEKDYLAGIKKGDWICVAAETLEDIPVTYDDGGAYSILFIPTPHYPRPSLFVP